MKKNRNKVSHLIMALIAIIIFIFLPHYSFAQTFKTTAVNIFSTDPILKENSFNSFNFDFKGGTSIAACDLDGNGSDEIIIGAGPGGAPQVRIFDQTGKIQFTPGFNAYNSDFKGGVNVTCGDLDGNGLTEIVTAPKTNGGPQIRIFDRFGHPIFTPGFFAFAPEIKNGLNVIVGDLDGNGLPEIIAAPAYGAEARVKVFNRFGTLLPFDIFPFHPDFKGGVSLGIANIDNDAKDELILGVQNSDAARIKIMKLAPNRILSEFTAFPENFKGGINVAGGDIDHDNIDEIIVAANGSAPHVRAFEFTGQDTGLNFFAYEKNSKNGVEIESADTDADGYDEILTSPSSPRIEGNTNFDKYIEIDISDQHLQYFAYGRKIGEYTISTGKVSMPTPLGEFKILNKNLQAYSKKYALYMPYWMQITSAGHGIHGLPFWKLKGGGIIYEGESHLGKRVSHGCVRLPIAGAAELFQWVEIGTPVIIHM